MQNKYYANITGRHWSFSKRRGWISMTLLRYDIGLHKTVSSPKHCHFFGSLTAPIFIVHTKETEESLSCLSEEDQLERLVTIDVNSEATEPLMTAKAEHEATEDSNCRRSTKYSTFIGNISEEIEVIPFKWARNAAIYRRAREDAIYRRATNILIWFEIENFP